MSKKDLIKKLTTKGLITCLSLCLIVTLVPMETFAASKVPAKPKIIKAAVYNANNVKLQWSKAKNAVKYKVYRKKADGKFVLAKTTTKRTYNSKTLSYGAKYTFKVTAITKSGKENTSKMKTVYTKPAKPVINAKVQNKNQVKITWKKTSGASKYKIYRKKAGGKFVLVKTTTSRSFTNKKLAYNAKYTYKVIAVSKAGKINASKEKTILTDAKNVSSTPVETPGIPTTPETPEIPSEPVAPHNPEVSNLPHPEITELRMLDSYNIEIKWSSVPNALWYEIYEKKGDEDFKLISTVEKTEHCRGSFNYGTKYTYKIVAIFATGLSESKEKSFYTLAWEPSLTSAEVHEYNNVKLEWYECMGAECYKVYAKEGDNEFKCIATTTDTSFYHKDINCGQTYTYKLAALNPVGQERFSAEKTVQTYSIAAPLVQTMPNGPNVLLTWSEVAVNGEEAYYELFKSKTPDGPFEYERNFYARKYEDYIGDNNVYYYKVRATYDSVEGPFSNVVEGKSGTFFKKILMDGVTFTVNVSQTHWETVRENGQGHNISYFDLTGDKYNAICPTDRKTISTMASISLQTDKTIDYRDLEYIFQDNKGLSYPSHLIDKNGNPVDPTEDVGTYHVYPNWENPTMTAYATYRPGHYIEHLVDIHFYQPETVAVEILYKGNLLFKCEISGYYLYENYQNWLAEIKGIEKAAWKNGMSDREKLDAFGEYVGKHYTYEEVDCKDGAMMLVQSARNMGLDACFRFGYQDEYDYTSAGTIGGHTSAVVEIDSVKWIFDVQGGRPIYIPAERNDAFD